MKKYLLVILKILKIPGKIIRQFQSYYYTCLTKAIVKKYSPPIKVNGKVILTAHTSLGKNTNFNGLIILGGGDVSIGDNFHSGTECMLITQNHNYDSGEAVPYDSAYIKKSIIITDNVWLGNRVIILGGVTIAEGAIIQAGSVVTEDIPRYAIAGGNPARVFKYRDIKHYERLKSKEKFH